MEMVVIFFIENFGAKRLGSIAYTTASNRYRKVEDTEENISVKFPAHNSHTLRNHVQTATSLNDSKSNDCFNVSVGFLV